VDEAMVDEALRVLHRYSLIDHDRSSPYREVRVHQLVQRATRENLTTTPYKRLTPLNALACAAAEALIAVWPQIERDELGQVLRANTAALQQAAGPALWTTAGLAQQQAAKPGLLKALAPEGGWFVLFRAVTSLEESGQVADARDAWTALYRDALRYLGPDHPDTLTTRHYLAYWRGKMGDAAGAATEFEALLADRLRVQGRDHPDTLTERHNLARGGARWGTRRARLARTKRCWPIICGCWVATTERPWLPSKAWRTGEARRGTRRARSPSLRRCWPTICGCWVPITPEP